MTRPPTRRALPPTARRQIALRSAVETLEGRLMPAAFTVNTFADAVDVSPGSGTALTAAGKISLRSAVQESNALGGSNTINLPAGTYALTLAPVAGDATAASGALDVTSDLTLVGGGAATTTIDASGITDRALDVRGAVTVAVSGVTITGGSGDRDNAEGSNSPQTGGGVSLSGGTLTLTDCAVSGNHAYFALPPNSGAAHGGGIYNSGGQLTLKNTTVSGNRLFMAGDPNPIGGDGGGIFNYGGQLTLINSSVVGNLNTNGVGGGVWNGPGIINNARQAGTLTATGSTINGNDAPDGGGLFNGDQATLTGCAVNSNTAGVAGTHTGAGGGIANAGQLVLNNCTVNSNQAFSDQFRPGVGGGIYDTEYGGGGTSMLTGTSVNNNTAGLGGGIYHGAGKMTVTGGTVTGNSAEDGGGFYNTSNLTQNGSTAQVALNNVTVNLNQAIADPQVGYGGGGDGGGIFNGGGSFELKNSTVKDNFASAGNGAPTNAGTRLGEGGGIFDYKAGGGNSAIVNDSTISTNSAQFGGGIAQQTGTLILINSTVNGNTAKIAGGGVLIGPVKLDAAAPAAENPRDSLASVTISGNFAPVGSGLLVVGPGTATVINSIVARDAGGSDFVATPGAGGAGLSSSGHNLIGDASGAAVFTAAGDQNNVDPKLGPLADNGGPTFTQALLPGSPALGAGDPNSVQFATDQRGLPRVVNSKIDIGAFETQPATGTSPNLSVTGTATKTVMVGNDITYTLTVPNTGQGGATGVVLTDTLPAGLTFKSAALGQTPLTASSTANGVVTLPLGNLAAGATDTVTILATPSTTGTLTNSVSVKANEVSAGTPPVTQETVVTLYALKATTTTLTATPNPSVFQQDVTFTATVDAGLVVGGVRQVMLESVVFTIDASPQPAVPIHVVNGHGQATYHTSSLGVGAHTVVASYSGTTEYGSSTSNPLTQTVKGAATLSVVPVVGSAVGQPSLFHATLTLPAGTTGTPTGKITLTVDGKAVPALPPGPGLTALFSVPGLKAGTHRYTASYPGDTAFGASQATPGTFTVAPAGTQTTLTSSPNPSAAGQPVTFTAEVVPTSPTIGISSAHTRAHAVHARQTALPPGYPPFAGVVTFLDGATVLGTAPVRADGTAVFTTTSLPPGRNPVTATFGHDPDYAPSTSAALIQVVTGDADGPRVVSVRRYGYHQTPTTLVVAFDTPLDPGSAGTASNYRITDTRGVAIPVVSAFYDAAGHSVTLYPSAYLDLHRRFTLTVNGSTPGEVKGATGSLLDGTGRGRAGGDYVTTVDAANLVVTNPFAAGATAALRYSAQVRAADALRRL